MMPPMCVMCRARPESSGLASDDFTLVEFRPTATYPEDWAGHPADLEWFCPSHAPLAEGLTHLPVMEALRHIQAKFRERKGQGT